MPKVEVLSVLGVASIQDIGRAGIRRFGVPVSGFMDQYSAVGANEWLGKPKGSPLLELIGGSIKLRFNQSMHVAITGAQATVKNDSNEMEAPCLLEVVSGQLMEVSAPVKGLIIYLAFEGNLLASKHFGSYSTLPQANLGGLEGRYLKKGDILEIANTQDLSEAIPFKKRYYADSVTVRCYKGPEFELLDLHSKERFFKETFSLTYQMSRMGYRLAGQQLTCACGNLSSRATQRGTIQLPSDGQPIILMADAQTTGGYPRIGQIAEPDVDLLAQMRPGSKVRFQPLGF